MRAPGCARVLGPVHAARWLWRWRTSTTKVHAGDSQQPPGRRPRDPLELKGHGCRPDASRRRVSTRKPHRPPRRGGGGEDPLHRRPRYRRGRSRRLAQAIKATIGRSSGRSGGRRRAVRRGRVGNREVAPGIVGNFDARRPADLGVERHSCARDWLFGFTARDFSRWMTDRARGRGRQIKPTGHTAAARRKLARGRQMVSQRATISRCTAAELSFLLFHACLRQCSRAQAIVRVTNSTVARRQPHNPNPFNPRCFND